MEALIVVDDEKNVVARISEDGRAKNLTKNAALNDVTSFTIAINQRHHAI